jgi:prepilin-type processing-associated H-X9-DG protein/prepilin-type N-terminal cleavage/methylation domain-containing protein
MKHRLNTDKNDYAFALVELLVVIAIIGILAALLLAAISQSEARAQWIQCVNNVRQLGMVLRTFVTDNNKYPLFINPYAAGGNSLEYLTYWTATLQRQLDNQIHTNDTGYLSQGIWKCPAANRPPDWVKDNDYNSYGYNGRGLSHESDFNSLGLGGTYNWPIAPSPAPPVNESQIQSPSEMMAISDGFMGGNGFIKDGGWLIFRDNRITKDWSPPETTKRSYARHQGKANVVFCDGHVESPTLQFLFEDTSDAALVRWNRDHLPHREKLSP